jgi:hypothetical protein
MYPINIDDGIENFDRKELRFGGMFGLGISVGIHIAGLLSLLLLTKFSASGDYPNMPDIQFVSVRLVEPVPEPISALPLPISMGTAKPAPPPAAAINN